MRRLLLILAAASTSSAALAADPKASGQCWADGTCLSESLAPVEPAKETAETTQAAREGRPYYRAPVYYLPPPVPYTASSPVSSICYTLNNGIYSAVNCPPASALPPLPRTRRR